MRLFLLAALAQAACAAAATDAAGDVEVQFGIHDYQVTPPGGWQLMSVQDFQKYGAAFIASYNAKGGLKVIRSFESGNCCFALKGGKKITVPGSAYGYQFPASADGQIRCNPKGGYTDDVYQFWKTPKLAANTEFGEQSAETLHLRLVISIAVPHPGCCFPLRASLFQH